MPDIIELTLPDGHKLKVEKGITALDAARQIGPALAKVCVAAKLDGKPVDLSHKIEKHCKLVLIKGDSEEGLDVMRHSASHVMAQAVLRLFPDAKLTIGPIIEGGFYYDFERKEPFTPADLEKIEHEMKKIIDEEQPFERKEMKKKEAMALYSDNMYKREVIGELPEDAPISVYYNRKTSTSPKEAPEFFDLCMGPHLPSTGKVGAYKLLKVAGAYWRGDAKNPQLQRIYATAFVDKKQLAEYLKRIEEAEKRDHRRIGRELGLIMFSELAPGMPILLPNGMVLRGELEKFMREELDKRDYVEIRTPVIFNNSLWHTSGHWDHYKDNMYFTEIEAQQYALKPMNCPGCMLVFANSTRSYRDLPIRFSEFGLVHRHELSGVLSGMFRVRAFTQDDAHIFATDEQIEQEVISLIELIGVVFKTFGFEYTAELSTRPEHFMGEVATWDKAEKALKNSLEKAAIKYVVNEGDGAFYGPKIDFKVKDAIGRVWQLSTIQMDFQMPARFGLQYEGADGKPHVPIVIHRAIYGSMERFMGVLIEHYAGKFPLWLAPVQVSLLPMAGEHKKYARDFSKKLKAEGIRAVVDERDDTIGSRIRDAQMQKIPYMLVIGGKEMGGEMLNVRQRDGKVFEIRKDEFILRLKKMIKDRKGME